MKIIHVTQFLGIGGLEKIIFLLALEQQKRGHNVSIYVYDHEQAWVEYFKQQGLNVITPPLKKAGYDLKLLLRMKKDLFDSDIIHTHDINPLMYLAPLYFLLFWKRRKLPKLIHTAHGMDHVKNYPRALFYEKFISRIVDKVIGVSDKIGEFYRNVCRISPSQVIVIKNGISLPSITITKEMRQKQKLEICQKYDLEYDKPLVLSLSRITPLKDQEFLIQAITKRPNVQLLIAGPPSDQLYFDKLKQRETMTIKLIGAQSEVSKYNMASDLYVSASTHEGIPVAVLEAMAVLTPCLVSDIEGHKALNSFDKVIEIYPLKNEESFLQSLDRVLSSTENEMKALKAQKVVEQHFSIKNMVDQYIEAYQ